MLLAGGGGQAAAPDGFGPLYALYQQLEQDYVEADEVSNVAELDRQAAIAQHAVTVARGLGNRDLIAAFEHLASRMLKHEEALKLRDSFRALERKLDGVGRFPRWPSAPPDLARAKALFSTDCALCHGRNGDGGGPAAGTFKPPPENFLLSDTANPMSPWRAFVSIRWGVHDSPMPAFETLTDGDAWSLAFYVLTLRQPSCDGSALRVSLRELATRTDLALMGQYREAAMPCLRRSVGP